MLTIKTVYDEIANQVLCPVCQGSFDNTNSSTIPYQKNVQLTHTMKGILLTPHVSSRGTQHVPGVTHDINDPADKDLISRFALLTHSDIDMEVFGWISSHTPKFYTSPTRGVRIDVVGCGSLEQEYFAEKFLEHGAPNIYLRRKLCLGGNREGVSVISPHTHSDTIEHFRVIKCTEGCWFLGAAGRFELFEGQHILVRPGLVHGFLVAAGANCVIDAMVATVSYRMQNDVFLCDEEVGIAA